MSPFLVLLIGIAFVIVAIAVFRFHPFFALILAAVLVGAMSPQDLPGEEGVPQATRALELTAKAFGSTAGTIGIVIALAAVIGQALMESGAADKITRRLLAFLGERRANWALLGSGYILSVPVFFDTVFFLLVPLARALGMRTGRNFLLYVMAICAGGAVTHSIVPPTPGPLVMADQLGIDLGVAIYGGFLLGLPVAILGGIWLPRVMSRFTDPPLRDTAGSSRDDLRAIVGKAESELPGFLPSILPVALPVVLITLHSVVDATAGAAPDPESYASTLRVTSFLGDKLFALGSGTAIALWVLARQKGYSISGLMDSLEPAISAAGTIILITSAGGAFGSMLRETGIGDEIGSLASGGGGGLWLLVIAWGVAAVLKVAQGSGTVSMVTASGIMGAILEDGYALPYHPIYVFAAIAFGSKFISWMNDSGFWVVCKMSGFTQAETLRTWTVLLGFMGVAGLIEVLVLSQLLPFAP